MLAVFVCNMRESIIMKLILKKLSVNEAKWTDLLASNCVTIQHVLILKFTFSPKSYRFFQETAPRPQLLREWMTLSTG